MTANWDGTEATTVAGQMFSRYAADNIVGVFAHSDVMLDGAILAGERSGTIAGRDYVAVGADCDPVGYRNIEAGKQYATALWDPFALGRTGAEVTVNLLKGGRWTSRRLWMPPPSPKTTSQRATRPSESTSEHTYLEKGAHSPCR